jgi:hypothetical protein
MFNRCHFILVRIVCVAASIARDYFNVHKKNA